MTWAVDLDGVVWLAGRAIPGSADAIAALRASGERVVFLTNNSGPLLAEHLEALSGVGVEAGPEDLVTSAQAAASVLPCGTRVAFVGDSGVAEALTDRGLEVVPPGSRPDALVVGRTTNLDYWQLSSAASAVRDGARFVATNTDATFPTGDRLLPGAGALVAFVSAASGRQPEIAGMPAAPMVELVRARYGSPSMVAGDRPDTDGQLARTLGARFGLVLTGVTGARDLPVQPSPDLVAEDLASLVRAWLTGGPATGG